VRAPRVERTVVTRMTAIVESAEEGVTRNRLLLRPLSAEKLDAAALPVKVRISQRGPLNVQAGDAVSLTARLLPPPHPVLPGGYDFARDAFFKQIGAVGSVAGKVTVTASPAELPAWRALSAAIDRARNDLTTRIAMLIGGQEGALTAAMITGKRGLIEEMRNADMRAAGIYHIVSISGLHMVLAAGIFLWVVRLAFALSGPLTARWPTKKLAAGIAMLGATAYCIFSGSEVATVRSLIMTLCILGAILFDRPALSMRNLAVSALLVLAIEPEELLGPSFQMSFAAVAALIAGSHWLRLGAGDGRHRGIPGRAARGLAVWMAASVGTTLLATAATSPFAAFHFHQFSPYGILGNAVAIPVMEILVMPASILGVALVPFGLDAPIWWLTGQGAAGVLALARWIAGIPGARLSVPGLDMPAMLLFAGGFMLLVLLASRLRYLGLPLLVAASAIAARPQVPDLWIDRRGDAVAVKGADGQLQVFGPGVSAFMLSNWLPAAGDERAAGDPTLHGAARCDGQGCAAQMADGSWLSLVREPPAFEEDCRRAAVIVTPLVAPAWCRPALALIDYRFLARHGATLATLNGGKLFFQTSRDERLNRPWWPAFKPFKPSGQSPQAAQ
jgi:competence protein ComEC